MSDTKLKFVILSRWAAALHDLCCVVFALVFSYWLRFNFGDIPSDYRAAMLRLLPLALPAQLVVFWLFGLYRGFWRFASIPDLMRILKSVGLGTLLLAGIAMVLTRMEGVPRSVFFLYPLLLAAAMCLSRISYRWFKDHHLNMRLKEGKKTLIIGAGRAGEMLVRDLRHRQEYMPIAFIDDDIRKRNREIHGIKVIGGTEKLAEAVNLFSIELVVLAIPSADKETIRRLVDECTRIGVRCQTLPSVFEMEGAEVDAGRLRPVTMEDLLGRESIELDRQAIEGCLKGKTVLVTGGGGSIGSELCRQVAKENPAKLIILDNSEFNLYSIDHELKERNKKLHLESVLGDVRNADRVCWVFETFAPDVVFHAAAYKHVPLVELNPAEGVINNVIGTKILADASDAHKVERFVLVSTDKAVNPANIMGATKRIAELYCQNMNARSATRFITTRFGNVLGSAGSVVPLFQRQINAGGPVTVTHPEITRYFMTIPESVSLILQAGAMGEGGEIFVLDMGKPVLIRHLAEQMIRLSGFVPDKDIRIVFTGLRPGEKLFEEIFHEREELKQTGHVKLLLARSRKVDWEWLQAELGKLQDAAILRDIGGVRHHMRNIVPEFQSNSVCIGGTDGVATSLLDNGGGLLPVN